MKAIYINDDLHRQAKLHAAKTGMPLKDLIETWVRQGLREISSETPKLLRESVAVYEVATPVETIPAASPARSAETEPFLADLERRGLLVYGERLRAQFQAEYLALRRTMGIITPPPAEPPDLEAIREGFRQQYTRYPDTPTASELVIQMREEE